MEYLFRSNAMHVNHANNVISLNIEGVLITIVSAKPAGHIIVHPSFLNLLVAFAVNPELADHYETLKEQFLPVTGIVKTAYRGHTRYGAFLVTTTSVRVNVVDRDSKVAYYLNDRVKLDRIVDDPIAPFIDHFDVCDISNLLIL